MNKISLYLSLVESWVSWCKMVRMFPMADSQAGHRLLAWGLSDRAAMADGTEDTPPDLMQSLSQDFHTFSHILFLLW